jgi:hypothetical protein
MGIRRYIVDEGFFASILSSSTWKGLSSPKIALATSELLDFDKNPKWEPWSPPLYATYKIIPKSWLSSFLTLVKK